MKGIFPLEITTSEWRDNKSTCYQALAKCGDREFEVVSRDSKEAAISVAVEKAVKYRKSILKHQLPVIKMFHDHYEYHQTPRMLDLIKDYEGQPTLTGHGPTMELAFLDAERQLNELLYSGHNKPFPPTNREWSLGMGKIVTEPEPKGFWARLFGN